MQRFELAGMMAAFALMALAVAACWPAKRVASTAPRHAILHQ